VRKLLLLLTLAGAVTVAVLAVGGSATGGAKKLSALQRFAQGQVNPGHIKVKGPHGGTVDKTLPFLSGATLTAQQAALCTQSGAPNCDERAAAADATGDPVLDGGNGAGSTATGVGVAHTLGCGSRNSSHDNVRVNQDCTYRRQAEEEQVYNPADPTNLIAGQNDSRVGFNQCGTDFSTNNGRNWGDELPPFRQKLNNPAGDEPTGSDPNRHTILGDPGTAHTYDAGSDPALAADSTGHAYFSCVVFDVATLASGLYVTMSPQGADGSFYYNWSSRPFTVVEDNSPLVFHDKNFIAADIYPSSPNRDNVYVTWTVFRFDSSGNYQRSPIFGSMSTDHGIHWSTPQEISGISPTLCQFGDAFDSTQNPNACNFDQGSDPVVLPNGDLEVVFNNSNTPTVNGQQLAVHCHPIGNSAAGTANLNCAAPVKVGDDVAVGEPQCNFGRGPEECIPGNFVRTNDFPRILTENTQSTHLYAVWQDYRNGEFDIQESQSLDGGLTWHEVGTVNPDNGLDHYFAAVDQSPQQADRIGVSYYRTDRVPNESAAGSAFTGGSVFAPCGSGGSVPAGADACAGVDTADSDYVLAGGSGAQTPYDFKVLSPVFPPPDGIQTGFIGDYSGLVINKGNEAHPIWADTRNVDPFAPTNGVVHDEDIFTDNVGLPNGKAKAGPGTIGHS
jgi:hypothetical protein